MKHSYLLISTSLFIAVPAWAQQPATAPMVGDPRQIEDIVVTARKITESAQSAPISIVALDSKKLDQFSVKQAADLQYKIPGLVIAAAAGTSGGRVMPTFAIRGITNASVAVYVNGVPLSTDFQGRTTGSVARTLYDLATVEVVKGPQGTLSGRNSVGGSVFFRSQLPTEDLGGSLRFGYDNLETKEFTGMLNVPILSDKVLLRISGQRVKAPGFTKNVAGRAQDDKNYWSFRSILTVRPTEGFENNLIYQEYHANEQGAGFILTGLNTNCPTPATRLIACVYPFAVDDLAAQQARGPRATSQPASVFIKEDAKQLTNITTLEVDDGISLKNIFGYQKYIQVQNNSSITARVPFFPFFNNFPNSTISNESQFLVDIEGFKGVAGFYYDRQKYLRVRPRQTFIGTTVSGLFQNYTINFFNSPNPAVPQNISIQSFPSFSNESKALFGNFTYDGGGLIPGLSIGGGYRYTWSKVRQVSQSFNNGVCSLTVGLPNLDLQNCTTTLSANFNAPTWTGNIQYKFAPQSMLYASISRGYKQGGFNPSSPDPRVQTYGPEKLTSYEAGLKSDFRIGDVPMRFNLTGFYGDYKGIQRTVAFAALNPATGAINFNSVTANAATGRIWGIETELVVSPMEGLQLSANYNYLNTGYKKYLALLTNGSIQDRSSFPFPGAPKHTLTLVGEYSTELPDNLGTVVGTLSSYTRSSVVFTPDNAPKSHASGFTTMDFRLDWREIAQSSFDLSFYIKNLTNKTYPLIANEILALGYSYAIYAEPRVVGGQVTFRF